MEDRSAVANQFNEYFCSVFTKEDLSQAIPEDHNYCSTTLQDVQIDQQMVLMALSKLRVDKATGPDALSTRLLLQIKEEISYPLTRLFRQSLHESSVPSDWKQAYVCPIFKKGNRHSPENYRPVSLTCQLGKVFESILRDVMVTHLESTNSISDSQHGFRRKRSCLTNLLAFLDKVTGEVDSGEDIDVIFFDFAKAFDKVPHLRLVRKLQAHGIQGKLLGWITEWLRDRRQAVCINGILSEWRPVISGVPQGSVLGPIMFLIYINDLDNGVTNWILKFADDTKLFGRASSPEGVATLQTDINQLIRWSEEWQMLFNRDKCKVMHIGRSNKQAPYSMGAYILTTATSERDLGITISSDLKPALQCSQAYGKASKMLAMIFRTISYKTPHVLTRLYKSLVRPHVEYCTAAWSPYYVKDRDLIERVQRRFTRKVPGLAKLDYVDRLKRLGLWSLEARRTRADLLEVYKIIHGLSAIKAETFFEFNTSCCRGHSLKLSKNRVFTDLRQKFFSERVISSWNGLSNETVTAKTFIVFKQKLEAEYNKDGSRFGPSGPLDL